MIRKVKPTDAKAIVDIYNEYVVNTDISFEVVPLDEFQMRRRIENIMADGYPYLVYEDENGIAGYCYAHRWKERAAYNLCVETTVYCATGRTQKGIGFKLMQSLIAECRVKGFHALIACITADNEASRRFHQKLGFHEVSHFEKVGMKYGRLLDVVDYELLLI